MAPWTLLREIWRSLPVSVSPQDGAVWLLPLALKILSGILLFGGALTGDLAAIIAVLLLLALVQGLELLRDVRDQLRQGRPPTPRAAPRPGAQGRTRRFKRY